MTDSLFESDNDSNLTPEEVIQKRLNDKDKHIQNVESELAELRAELRSRTSLEELVNKVSASQVTPTPVTPVKETEPTQSNDSTADLTEKVRELLRKEKENENKALNLQKSEAGLREKFGADYKLHLEKIRQKLGVSQSFLEGLATSSPEGFLSLVEANVPPESKSATPPPSSVDTSKAFGQNTVRGASFYRDLRKKDINQYFSARVQKQMHDDAISLGMDKFNAT